MFTTQSEYAWIIDSNREERTISKIGPWNARPDLVVLLEYSDAGKDFRIVSNDQIVYQGRIIGIFNGREPFNDLNFVPNVDIIEYKNIHGYWEAV